MQTLHKHNRSKAAASSGPPQFPSSCNDDVLHNQLQGRSPSLGTKQPTREDWGRQGASLTSYNNIGYTSTTQWTSTMKFLYIKDIQMNADKATMGRNFKEYQEMQSQS